MKSIRSFLLTRLLLGAALVLATAGGVVYVLVARSLGSQFDLALAERVQGFASILFQTEDTLTFEFSDELMPEFERKESPEYFQLWFADGLAIERSESLGATDLVVAVEPVFEPAFWTAALPDAREGRFVARLIEVHHVYPEEGPGRPEAAVVLVALARGTETLLGAQRAALGTCIAFSLGLLVLIGLIARHAVDRGLQPADRLAATLDAIEVDDLPESLDVGELPIELAPVAETTDALLQRVDAAFKRERRTTADIAHELRTPISELITSAEVALRDTEDAEGGRRALSMVREVAWRMERSVSILLQLARLEMGVESFEHEPVDLGELVHECLGTHAAEIRSSALCMTNLVPMDTWVHGDPEVLRIVVSNLISNAVTYSPESGVVRCELEQSVGGWRLRIENDTDDLRPLDMPSVSQPFWRKDRARADRDRSGLGLALSHALAEKNGLELDLSLERNVFRVSLGGPATNGHV